MRCYRINRPRLITFAPVDMRSRKVSLYLFSLDAPLSFPFQSEEREREKEEEGGGVGGHLYRLLNNGITQYTVHTLKDWLFIRLRLTAPWPRYSSRSLPLLLLLLPSPPPKATIDERRCDL